MEHAELVELTAIVLGIVFVLLALVAWVLSGRHRFARARLRRELREAPTTRVREARDGATCKIVGKIVCGGETLVAPSGRACVHYAFEVLGRSRREARGDYPFFPAVLVDDSRSLDFFVDDGSGLALVRASAPGTRVLLVKDLRMRSEERGPRGAQFEEWMDRYRLTSRGIPPETWLESSEGALQPGETVVVRGRATRGSWPGPAAHGAKPVALALDGGPELGLVVSEERALR